MEIRVYKGEAEDKKCWSLGLGGSKSRHPHIEHTVIKFPKHFCHATIRDGEIETPTDGVISIENINTYEPVPAEEIAEALFRGNCFSRGRDKLVGYGEKGRWFFDYSPELKEFFEKFRLPIPADGRSKFERVQERALLSLEQQGLIKRGIGGANPDGQGAIEAAKLKRQQEELEKTKAEIEALKAQLAANKAETVEVIEAKEEALNSPEIPEGSTATDKPKKKPGKKKVEA